MGIYKRQQAKENKMKKNEDYKYERSNERIQKEFEKSEILKNVVGYGHNLPKSYMEMMFRNYQTGLELEKKYGVDYVVEKVDYDFNTDTCSCAGAIKN